MDFRIADTFTTTRHLMWRQTWALRDEAAQRPVTFTIEAYANNLDEKLAMLKWRDIAETKMNGK